MSKTDDAARKAARALISGRRPDTESGREYLASVFALVDLLPRPERALNLTGKASESRDASSTRKPQKTVAIPRFALAALLAAIVFVTVLLFIPRPGFAPEQSIALFPTGAARDAQGTLLVGGERYLIFASGLSELEQGYRYVLWSVNEGAYTRLASLVYLGDGRVRHAGSAAAPAHVEVTIESSTGTLEPAGPTVLVGLAEDN